MFARVKRALLVLWAVLLAFAVIAGAVFLQRKRRSILRKIEEDAENAKRKTENKIENTPASELIADSGNADALRTERRAAKNVG